MPDDESRLRATRISTSRTPRTAPRSGQRPFINEDGDLTPQKASATIDR